MRKIQCIIKVTNGCNLRCSYCYNAAKGFKSEIISLEKLEQFFSLFSEFDCIQVIFHGGEPMLAGIKFYEEVMELEERFTFASGVTFENEIQTNGTLINDRWLSFFKKHKIAVGLSFDGIYNDAYRGETQKVLDGIDLLKKHGLSFGCMAVVADPHYDLIKNYEYFKSLRLSVDFSYVAVEGNAREIQTVLPCDNYTDQLIRLFDRWMYEKDGISVRNLEFMVKKVLKCNYEYCSNGSCVGNFFCIDVDGSIYGCSMESAKKYCFGNVGEFQTFHDVINSDTFKSYVKGAIERRKKCAATCSLFEYCKGGCNDNAINNGDISEPDRAYCEYFRAVFTHVKDKIDEITSAQVDLGTLDPYFTRSFLQTLSVDETGKI